MSDLDHAQRQALIAAHKSINHGGLQERTRPDSPATCWRATHPRSASEHEASAVWPLIGKGLLGFVGKPCQRSAHITESGILELDIVGGLA